MTRRVAEGDACLRPIRRLVRLGADADAGHGRIGKTLGIVGMGRIGPEPWLRKRATGFNMRILYTSTHPGSSRTEVCRLNGTRTSPICWKEADFC